MGYYDRLPCVTRVEYGGLQSITTVDYSLLLRGDYGGTTMGYYSG